MSFQRFAMQLARISFLAALATSAVIAQAAPGGGGGGGGGGAAGKIAFQFFSFPDDVVVDADRSFAICLVNKGQTNELRSANADRLVLTVPVGGADRDLLDGAVGVTCDSPPAGWECLTDASDPASLVVTLRPIPGTNVTVTAGQSLCFDVAGGHINAAEGLAFSTMDQFIAASRAEAPENRLLGTFKSLEALVVHEDVADDAIWSNNILDGSIANADLGANSVDSSKVLDGSLQLVDIGSNGASSGQVIKWNGTAWVPAMDDDTDTPLAPGQNITIEGIDNEIAVSPQGPGSSLNADMLDDLESSSFVQITTPHGGDVSGVYSNLQIAAGAVGSPEIADGSVSAADLAFDPATQAELDAEAAARSAGDSHSGDVSGPHDNLQIGAGVVGSLEIADGSLSAADLAFDPATQAELDAEAAARSAGDTHSGDVAGPHDNLQIGTGAVGSVEIADGSVAEVDLAFDAVTQAQLDAEAAARSAGDTHSGDVAGPHDNLQIGTGAVGSVEIADASIAAGDLAFDPATQAELDAEAAARAAGDAHAGDVAGPNGNLQIQPGAITLADIGQNGAAVGAVMQWNGAAWVPAAVASDPIGSMQMYAGATAPQGWLLCEGQMVSRTTYAALFAVTGTTYGTGDGSTTFNVPDMRVRHPLGRGASGPYSALGNAGGSMDHVHEMSHVHGLPGTTTSAVGDHAHGVSLSTTAAGNHSHAWLTREAPVAGGARWNSADGQVFLQGAAGGQTSNHYGVSGPNGTDAVLYGQGAAGTQWRTASEGSHSHSVSGGTSASGSHAHSVPGGTSGQPSTSNTASSNAPYMVVNFIIKH